MSEVTERQRTSRLLIVEDDQAQLRTLTAIMEDEGFEVIGCAAASAALERVQEGGIDVAIVDLRLPDLSGTQLLERLRERTLNDQVRVIVNTGYASFDSAKDALNLGAFAYVEKGGDPDELLRHVRRAFRAHLDRYTEDLETLVAERTAELTMANRMLKQEITERRQAEGTVRAAKEFTDRLIESMQDGLSVLDVRGAHIDVNPAFCEMTGFSRAELIGAGPPHPYWPPEARAEVEDAYRKTLRGERDSFELSFMRKNGERFPVIVSSSHVKDEWGNIVSYFATIKDITERKRAEERLRQQEIELAHVGRLSTLGEMASGIAHQLNQPLFAIMNYAEACKRSIEAGRTKPAEIVRDLQSVVSEGQQAGEIIRRLRDFARKREPRWSSVDLNELVREVLRFVKSEAHLGGIQVRAVLARSLPTVQGDAVLLQQVILNLLRNAIDALRDADQDRRELTVHTSTVEGNLVAVAVRDTGSGVTTTDIDRLFEPFFTTKPEGLGLGLSISRSIIEADGGQLTAVRNPDRGMTFRFTLPVSE